MSPAANVGATMLEKLDAKTFMDKTSVEWVLKNFRLTEASNMMRAGISSPSASPVPIATPAQMEVLMRTGQLSIPWEDLGEEQQA